MDTLLSSRNIIAMGVATSISLVVVGITGQSGAIAFGLSLLLLVLGQPLFAAYAMARPNARSSHHVPVPQGGGGPVVLATLIAMMFGLNGISESILPLPLMGLVIGTVLLAVVGGLDDIRGLPVLPRLMAQFAAVGCIVFLAPENWRVFGHPMPLPVERILLILAGVWFVNLTNFMDGIDGITLATFMPLAAGSFWLADAGVLSVNGKVIAGCFLAAQAAFIFFNWHPARLFLGDLGSLPMGLMGGALLLDLAAHGAVAAAVMLPLYHFTDATLTLLRRVMRGERIWEAHRQHAYQSAVIKGWSHTRVSAVVLLLNLMLVVLAWASVGHSFPAQCGFVALAFGLVMATMALFRGKQA